MRASHRVDCPYQNNAEIWKKGQRDYQTWTNAERVSGGDKEIESNPRDVYKVGTTRKINTETVKRREIDIN
jgi:hypothetical protein